MRIAPRPATPGPKVFACACGWRGFEPRIVRQFVPHRHEPRFGCACPKCGGKLTQIPDEEMPS